jgi:hypothetical protein
MNYKIIILFLLTSCINNNYISNKNFTYSAKGFAFIENRSINDANTNYFVSHNNLKSGTKISITNPATKVSIEAIINKKIKYDNFYKVAISADIAEKLKLNLSFPYVVVTEIKSNESFIAKKAITDNEEKKIANNAPITKINIDNLSKPKKIKKSKTKTYSILVANFYNLDSAELLKKKLVSILVNSNYQQIYINKINSRSYELLMGPYNTIKKLKNDYIVLDDSNYEDLDIKIND